MEIGKSQRDRKYVSRENKISDKVHGTLVHVRKLGEAARRTEASSRDTDEGFSEKLQGADYHGTSGAEVS